MKFNPTIRHPWVVILLAAIMHFPAQAFDSVDEQIDHYLEVLARGGNDQKIQMLKGLQWSGISDPRLFDPVAEQVESRYLEGNLNKPEIQLIAHQIRALGYSGNDKYNDLLRRVESDAADKRFRKHAKKALIELDQFSLWNMKIRIADAPTEGKSVEIATYMKMLSVDDPAVQRLGARAIYAQRLNDPDLINVAAQQLEDMYNRPGLDKTGQDTAAWLCKAIGQSGNFDHVDLLSRVAAESQYKKVRKHAQKYAK